MKKHLSFPFLFLIIVLFLGLNNTVKATEPTLEGEITQVIFPQESPIQGLHICLSYLRTLNGNVALVEDSSSCHYARRFRNQIGSWAQASAASDVYVEDESLKEILNRVAPKATFFILDVQ